MKIVNMAKVSKIERTGDFFMGGRVSAQELVTKETGNYCRVAQIHFAKGARNKFHTHSTYQLLIVTAGKGIVATENEQVVVGVGDIILFPAGENHWHGAAKDSEFSHIMIVPLGSEMTQTEK